MQSRIGVPLFFAATAMALTACDGERELLSILILDWDGTEKLVESKKGKVVVVDIWSTTCAPCVREFPKLVELQAKHAGAGLECISVSCDYIGRKDRPPEYYKDRVVEFLQKRGAFFENVLLKTEADELFDRLDLGSIPAVLVYDRDGALVKRFDNDTGEYGEEGFTYEKHINSLVEELLAKR